jgi:Acetyltransferase (GNAT) domain
VRSSLLWCLRSRQRFETALRIGSQPKLELLRNSGRKLLRVRGHSVNKVLRSYVGSSEWPGSAFLEDSRVQFAEPSARPSSAALMLNSADLSRECGSSTACTPGHAGGTAFRRSQCLSCLGFTTKLSTPDWASSCSPARVPGASRVSFFHTKTKAVYKFGASDEKHQDLRGNNLLMWNAIRFLAQNGIEALHFGRTSHENQGLRRFKRGWGTVEETIEYFRFGRAENNWISARGQGLGFSQRGFREVATGSQPPDGRHHLPAPGLAPPRLSDSFSTLISK